MDKKIIVIAVVAVIIVAAAAAIILMNKGGSDDKVDGLSIVGRVNSEGSGIILAKDQDASDYFTRQAEMPAVGAFSIYNSSEKMYYVFHPEGWGGKIFATPGLATIQHVQLMDLANLMHMKFASYTDGMTTSDDTIYYIAGVPSFAEFQNKEKSADLAGFIIWEAQFSVGVEKGYIPLVLTNSLFEGHTCCIIGASNEFLDKKEDAFVTFLSVYANAVDRINEALFDESSADYKTLVDIAFNRVTMPDGMTDEEKMNAIKGALENVTYLYADDSTGGLSNLKADIATLAENLYNAKQIQKSASDLGFKSYTELANKFVNDKYMKEAMKIDAVKLSTKTTINVAAISGDIHQIALWFAKDTGMFDAMNLEIVVYGQSAGPAVYGLIANGEADIGFLGAPPMTIRCMNAEDIHA